MQSFINFIAESHIAVQCSIRIDLAGSQPDSDAKLTIAFRGSNILEVSKAIAAKIDAIFHHDKKKAKSASVDPIAISITAPHSKFSHSVPSGRSFGNGETIIAALIHEFSSTLPKHSDSKEHLLRLEMWGNEYDEADYEESDEQSATKTTIFAKTFVSLAAQSAAEINKEFHKRFNKVTLNFAGIPEDSIEEFLYKAIIATKCDNFHF